MQNQEEHFYSSHNTASRALGNAYSVFHCSHILPHVKGKTKYESSPLVLEGGNSPEVQILLNYIVSEKEPASYANTT